MENKEEIKEKKRTLRVVVNLRKEQRSWCNGPSTGSPRLFPPFPQAGNQERITNVLSLLLIVVPPDQKSDSGFGSLVEMRWEREDGESADKLDLMGSLISKEKFLKALH